ncbi:MAG: HAD family phosphatase, partial [Ruegeria sp.]|nr:HAD family phosphatase [Ruegeria sp.]
MTRQPKAVLFDCDGTLLLTADLHFKAIEKAIENEGARLPKDWYLARTGLGRQDLLAAFNREFALDLDIAKICAESIANTLAMAGLACPNPPVYDLARRCSGHIPIAVVTNSERRVVTALLSQSQMLPLFDTVVSVDDVPVPKPAPDMFLLAANRLAVDPATCLVLEDSYQGVAAAIAAGMN